MTFLSVCSARFRRRLRRMAGAIELPPIPEHGVWTAVGLTRKQFLSILSAALVVFLCWDGPLWSRLEEPHTWRIVSSYTIIPLLVGLVLFTNRTFRVRSWFEASLLLALIKLVVTVAMFIAVAFLV